MLLTMRMNLRLMIAQTLMVRMPLALLTKTAMMEIMTWTMEAAILVAQSWRLVVQLVGCGLSISLSVCLLFFCT